MAGGATRLGNFLGLSGPEVSDNDYAVYLLTWGNLGAGVAQNRFAPHFGL